MCYLLLMHFSFVSSILIFSIVCVFLIFRITTFKNSIVLFGIVLICCVRIKYKPVYILPSNCYKIERIVKENKEKTVFIGKGKEKVLFSLKIKATQQNTYYPNDIVEYKARLNPLPLPKSLDGFVYADYLKKIGVDSVAYPIVFPKVLFRDTLSVVFLASKLRKSIVSYLLSFSKVTSSTKGFLIALLTGDKSFLNKKEHQLFRENGVVHVLAISGLHVGILYFTLCFLLSKLFRLSGFFVFYTIAILLITYAFITGLSPSVIRAVLMFILIHYGKLFHKSVSTLNIVFASAALMLFFNPDLMRDVGFQLSYSAVIGIVLIMQYSGFTDCFKTPYFNFFWKIILVNLAAFIFTAPVISFHFGIVNFTGIWASLVIVPLITIAMYLGIAILILSLNHFVAEKFFLSLDYLFFGLNKLLLLITESFNLSYHVFISGGILVACFSILIFLVTKTKKWFVISLLICFLAPFFPLNNKIQFLKVNSRIQLKFRNEIFYLKKGDSLFIENIEIFYQEKNKLSLQKLDYTKKIDFNVNNYQYLNLEF